MLLICSSPSAPITIYNFHHFLTQVQHQLLIPLSPEYRCSTNFYSYSSGVFNEDVAYSVDHAVVAIGYASNYFLVRNSWGTSWGVSGHIYLGRGLSSYNTYAYYSAHITSMSAMKRVEEKEE